MTTRAHIPGRPGAPGEPGGPFRPGEPFVPGLPIRPGEPFRPRHDPLPPTRIWQPSETDPQAGWQAKLYEQLLAKRIVLAAGILDDQAATRLSAQLLTLDREPDEIREDARRGRVLTAAQAVGYGLIQDQVTREDA